MPSLALYDTAWKQASESHGTAALQAAQPLKVHQYLVIRLVLIHSLEPANLALAGLTAPCEDLASILNLRGGGAQSVKLNQRSHCILWLWCSIDWIGRRGTHACTQGPSRDAASCSGDRATAEAARAGSHSERPMDRASEQEA